MKVKAFNSHNNSGNTMADRHPRLVHIRRGRKIQKDLALKLCRQANVPLGPYSETEISHFQKVIVG